MTYLLGKGTISSERSYSSFNKYFELSGKSKTLLREWHNRQVNALHIDLDKERISKVGFEAVISAIPGLIDDKFKYEELGRSFVHEIIAQAKAIPEHSIESKQVYDEDIEIVIRDGKYFFLHEVPNIVEQ